MRIFIIGASGLVGSHCLNYFKSKGYDVKGSHISFATNDTVYLNPSKPDYESDFDLMGYKPNVIVHCGALTNVDYCENNPEESKRSTVESAENMVDFCKENNVRLIYISTDYVFDGKSGPYTETAEISPLNVYGRHKLHAEQLVATLPDYLIARVTNVYGEEERSKNFIARLILWIKDNEEKELSMPVDQFATPVYAGDIAAMLYGLIADGKKGIYNLSSTDYMDRFRLAMKVKSYFPANQSVKIKPTITAALKQPALRPLYGGLLNIKFIQEYPAFQFTNVDTFIQRLIKHEL